MGPSSQPSFTEPPHTEIPPHQTPHAPDHALWMDLSAQISFLGTHMEELVVVSDTRLYSMDYHMNQQHAGFTSWFDSLEARMDQHQAVFKHLQQMIEHIEGCLESRHEEMMTYLRSVFSPPPSQP